MQINGYKLITKAHHSSTHGGLAIYLRNEISFNSLEIDDSQSNIWEGQFISIKINEKKLILGNIYRPPKDRIDNYSCFIEEFTTILTSFHGEVLVGGDFKIDPLKIKENQYFLNILMHLFAMASFPKLRFRQGFPTIVEP